MFKSNSVALWVHYYIQQNGLKLYGHFLWLITEKCSLIFLIIFWVCLNLQKGGSHQYLWPHTDVYRCSMVIMFLGDDSLMFPFGG